MNETEFTALRLRASLCPSLETSWDPPDTATHWKAMHDCAMGLREIVSKARADLTAIHNDKDLSVEGKRHRREEIVARAVASLRQSPALGKAQERVEDQMAKWSRKVVSILKPAQTEAEVGLHAEIRRHIASLKDQRSRMAFLEKHGSDIAVASSLFEAPAFLSGVTDAELALVRHKIEAAHLPAEVVEARAKTGRAWAELERAARLAPTLILQFAGMKSLPRRNNEPLPKAEAKAKEKAKETTPYWKPMATTVNSSPKPAPSPDWA